MSDVLCYFNTRNRNLSMIFHLCDKPFISKHIGNEVVNLKRFYARDTRIKQSKLNRVYRQFPNASFAKKSISAKTRIPNQGTYYSLLKLDKYVGRYTQLNNSTSCAMKSETGMWVLPTTNHRFSVCVWRTSSIPRRGSLLATCCDAASCPSPARALALRGWMVAPPLLP